MATIMRHLRENACRIVVFALVVTILAIVRSDGGVQATQIDPPTKSNPNAYAVWLVDQAISYYADNGRDAAIDRYSSTDNVDGQWYTAIIDEAGVIIAHFNSDLIGESLYLSLIHI